MGGAGDGDGSEDEPAEDEPAEDEPVEDEPVEDEPVEDEPVEDELCGVGHTRHEIYESYIDSLGQVDNLQNEGQVAIMFDASGLGRFLRTIGAPAPVVGWGTALFTVSATVVLRSVAHTSRERLREEYFQALGTC